MALIVLLNAHTSYSYGAAWNFGGTNHTEYKLSKQINKQAKRLFTVEADTECEIIDASDIAPYNASLKYKVSKINELSPSLVIETHFNSASVLPKTASGMEVLYCAGKSESMKLATSMVESMCKFLPFKIRRTNGLFETRKVYVLRETVCPAVILEICFLSHPLDRIFILNPRYDEVVANLIVDGVKNYLSKGGGL